MKILIIINDPPYGTERCYNALRLGSSELDLSACDREPFTFQDPSSPMEGCWRSTQEAERCFRLRGRLSL
jgi:hypothetical protein